MIINKFLAEKEIFSEFKRSSGERLKGATEEGYISLISVLFSEANGNFLISLPTLFLASKFYDALNSIFDAGEVLFYPADELITAQMYVASNEFKLERINTLENLLKSKKKIIVTHLTGLIKKQFKPHKWQTNQLEFKLNYNYDFAALGRKLLMLGYKRRQNVERIGDFAVRGSVIDIFPVNSDYPIRLDFFGDSLDDIRNFRITDQKSTDKLLSISFGPFSEMFFTEEEFEKGIKKIEAYIDKSELSNRENEKYQADLQRLKEERDFDSMDHYIGFFENELTSIIDYCKFDKIFLFDYERHQANYQKVISDLEQYAKEVEGYSIFRLEYFFDFAGLLNKKKYFLLEGLTSLTGKFTNLDIRHVYQYAEEFKILKNNILADYRKKTIIFSLVNLNHFKIIKDLLIEAELPFNVSEIKDLEINLINQYYPALELSNNIIIYNEESLFKGYRKRNLRYKATNNEEKLKSHEDLKPGDLLVHIDYGIGRYIGLVTMELDNLKRDYLHIQYQGDAKLYVPIEQFHQIMRYGGTEKANPPLSKIGSSTWEKTKDKVKTKVKDISNKLIKLYAEREESKGYQFLEDTHQQADFEDNFEYEETPDQLKTISEVKKDMETSRPMDRLICGDVGYGKTEIALRAAFKAVMNNKQVAYLAPTTVLARQHFQTFEKRFKEFGASIVLLSRYTEGAKEKKILEGLKRGTVDVAIGTHRILSKDIVFKDLGLLVIDEEQRFGVLHKERIKELKVNVDTITLTATPIPRTLQMSLVGIKDLSLLDTPPKNRYPIQTYVMERNDAVVREAIERELARGGQVFYLFNHVETISVMAERIKEMVPEARVCYAHGQMNKSHLENIIEDFVQGKYDILVCTTIIETGVDIPNTNTIIIHEAHLLGLSQLYQIRGRVGRSDKIAYCYLMIPKNKQITDKALLRLEAIKEFTELGSGFKIAMRDLSIRGAGDILGAEQSGFIDSVGIDLYMKILKDALNPDEKVSEEARKEVGGALGNRTVELKYVGYDELKIEVHRKIDEIKSFADLENIKMEIEDRFGKADEALLYYMYEKLFKFFAKILSVENIEKSNTQLRIIISQAKSDQLDGEKIFQISNNYPNLFKLEYRYKRINIIYFHPLASSIWTKELALYLSEIIETHKLDVED